MYREYRKYQEPVFSLEAISMFSLGTAVEGRGRVKTVSVENETGVAYTLTNYTAILSG